MPRRAPKLERPELRFFRPGHLGDLRSALEGLQDAPSALEVWDDYDADKTAWSVLDLPVPLLHPRAPRLLANAARASAKAITAVIERRAFVDDDGELRVWPWYPEEEAAMRPRAIAEAAENDLALPKEHLDEPYEPAHYHRRATSEALARWLKARGADAESARIARVPIPPKKGFKDQRFEGGMRADAPEKQATNALLGTARMFEYAGDDLELRAQLEARLARDLARLCDRFEGVATPADPREPEAITLPELERRPIGRVMDVLVFRSGALLMTDGAMIAIGQTGDFRGAWHRAHGDLYTLGELAVVNGSHVLDLETGEFLEGDLQAILQRTGLDLPSTAGHDERTAPIISGCGRYLLDVDESPYIVRLADRMTVAESHGLERAITPPKPHPKGLIREEDVSVAPSTFIDGVRFTARSGESPVRDGRSLAFALAGDTWRFLTGDAVRSGTRTITRLGVPIHGGAFSADGQTLWALSADHALRVDLAEAPTVGAIVPIAPLLAAAEARLGVDR